MARSPDWEKVPMAVGGDKPAWPMPTVTPKFATWSLGGGRPWGCAQDKCERWHAGVDLTGAPQGALVIAPEDALIVGLDKGWTDGTRAIFLRTDSNLFLVLGGVIAGSHKEFGVTTGGRVLRGAHLGRIGIRRAQSQKRKGQHGDQRDQTAPEPSFHFISAIQRRTTATPCLSTLALPSSGMAMPGSALFIR